MAVEEEIWYRKPGQGGYLVGRPKALHGGLQEDSLGPSSGAGVMLDWVFKPWESTGGVI